MSSHSITCIYNKTLLHPACVVACLLQLGCSAFVHQLPVTHPTAQQAWQALQRQQQTRQQLQAQLQVRAKGLAALVMKQQQLDVAVQSAPRLLLSWRSFFDQPALVIAYNGRQVCFFEPAQQPAIECRDAAAHDTTWLQAIDLPMSPQQIAAALLGVVPNLQNSQPVGFTLDKSGKRHRTVLLHNNGDKTVLQAHISSGLLTRYELYNAAGQLQYRLDYDMFKQTQHNMFAQRIGLRTYVNQRSVQLLLQLKEAQWNGAALPAKLFHLQQSSPCGSL